MSQTGSYISSLVWETTDGEGPTRSEYQINWNAMDGHLHDNRGAGRGVRGIQTTAVPTQTGDVEITGDDLKWWGSSAGTVQTALRLQCFVPLLGGTAQVPANSGLTYYLSNLSTANLSNAAFLSAGDINSGYVASPVAGTAKYLFVRSSSAPGVGQSLAFTVIKNGVAQATTCTISGTNTTASDSANTFAVAQGDLVSVRLVVSAANALSDLSWGLAIQPTTNS